MIGAKVRENRKGCHRTHPSSVEIFRWILRNGINKTDIYGIITKVLIQHYQRIGGPKSFPAGHPTLKGPKQVCSTYPTLEKLFLKLEGRDYREKSDQQ